jgi:hypothetical protein
MKKLVTICLVLSVVFVSSQAAFADWNEGDPAKYVQMPDLTNTGVDVAFSEILGDDFKCESTEAITDFHLWTSWKNDYLPGYDDGAGHFIPAPDMVSFDIAIYSDIPDPDGEGPGYSRPGEELWWTYAENYSTAPTHFTVDYYATAVEDWYDPVTGEYSQADHSGVWQYNFYVDTTVQDPFIQQGSAADPVTYWLVVDAFVWGVGADEEIDPELGWKTSLEQWNDDAVFWMPAGSWHELKYPVGHDYEGASMDLAFVITPEPATIVLLGLGGLALIRKRKV